MTAFDPPDDPTSFSDPFSAPVHRPDPAEMWAREADARPAGRRRGRLSPGRRRLVGVLVALLVLVAPAVAGYEVSQSRSSSTPAASGAQAPALGDTGAGSSGAGSLAPLSTGPASGSGNTTASTGRLDVSTVSDKVDDAVVSVWVTSDEGEGAGTGIVVGSEGLILTNNHVIANSRTVEVELVTTGQRKAAKVLGYSPSRDIALLQVSGWSNLRAADLGDSSTVAIGDPVLALGNAGGQGGMPMVVSGSVTALDQEITASDGDGSNVQTLTGLIETNANIQPGDSGGPLIDRAGRVIGVNAAASASNGTSTFGGRSQNQGYAIPMEDAIAVARQILSGRPTAEVHVGANRGILGVQISGSATTSRTTRGAAVLGVDPTGGAAKAGITAGATIVALDGRTIVSSTDLTQALVPYNPGDKVEVTWIDRSGATQRATVTLGSGPPA